VMSAIRLSPVRRRLYTAGAALNRSGISIRIAVSPASTPSETARAEFARLRAEQELLNDGDLEAWRFHLARVILCQARVERWNAAHEDRRARSRAATC